MKKETNIGLGIAIGFFYGLIFHNMAVGLILGALLGLMIPVKKKDQPNDDDNVKTGE